MAEIATYTCASNKCRFTVRLSRDFPIWHPETPKTLRSMSVSPAASKYVTGRRSDAYCITCKTVTSHDGNTSCKKCGNGLSDDLTRHPCAQCTKSKVTMPHLLVR